MSVEWAHVHLASRSWWNGWYGCKHPNACGIGTVFKRMVPFPHCMGLVYFVLIYP